MQVVFCFLCLFFALPRCAQLCKQVFKSSLTSYQRITPAWVPHAATIDQMTRSLTAQTTTRADHYDLVIIGAGLQAIHVVSRLSNDLLEVIVAAGDHALRAAPPGPFLASRVAPTHACIRPAEIRGGGLERRVAGGMVAAVPAAGGGPPADARHAASPPLPPGAAHLCREARPHRGGS